MNHRIYIAGVGFDNVDQHEAIQKIAALMEAQRPFYVVTPNPEFVLEAQKNSHFKQLLNDAALSVPDGTGIVWAGAFLNEKPPRSGAGRAGMLAASLFSILFAPSDLYRVFKARVTGADLMEAVVAESEGTGWRIFLLGAGEGVAEKALTILQQRYPKAALTGAFAGEAGPHGDLDAMAAIQTARPDIIFVAYGAPHQEEWIARNLGKLPTVKMAMGVGGTFDFIAGVRRRAPAWMRRAGLEWLWRLINQPSRLRRIGRATFGFIRLILQEQKKGIEGK